MRNVKFLPVTVPAMLVIAFVMMFGIIISGVAGFFGAVSVLLRFAAAKCEAIYYNVIARVDAYLIKNGGSPSCN
jgi:hypothetical protein